MKRFLPPALSLSLTAVLLGGCSGDPDTADIKVGTVVVGSVAEYVEAPATLAARANATLRAPAEGTVARLTVRDGDRVKKGEVVARVASPGAREQLEQAEDADREASRGVTVPAGLSLAEFQNASDKIAARGFKQARDLAKKIPDPKDRAKVLAEITKAEGDYTNAANAATAAVGRLNAGLGSLTSALASLGAAGRVQTRAAVKAARRTVAALVLRAPFSGVVSLGGPAGGSGDTSGISAALPASLQGLTSGLNLPGAASDASQIAEGAPVTSGAAVVTVTDVSELRLAADIDESDILRVRRGADADASFDALPDAAYTAEVYSVGVTPAKQASGGGGVTYKVQLTLQKGTFADGSAAPAPKPGMSAVVRLTVREVSDVLVVPTTAIVSSGRESTVWVVTGGRAERRTVVTGAESDTQVEVRSGLKAGDRIVVKNADAVRPRQELG